MDDRVFRAVACCLLAAALSACSPMFSGDLKDTVKELAKDRASACASVKGGAGAMTIGPGALPGGGGYGSLTLCRSNEPGSEIEVTDSAIKIKHGAALAAELRERLDTLETAVKYLLQKMLEAKKESAWKF